jgi:hypothetical protein
MEERQFDYLARRVATKTSRRQMLKVIAGAVGGMFLGRIAAVDPASAGPGPKCLREGAPCFSSCPPFIPCPQCCPGLTCSGGLISACVCESGVHCRPVGGGQAQCCPTTNPNNPCMEVTSCTQGSGGGCLFNTPAPNGNSCQLAGGGIGICQSGQCVPSEGCGALRGQPCGTSPSGNTCVYAEAAVGFDSEGYVVACVCTQGMQFPGQYGLCFGDLGISCLPGYHCYPSTTGAHCAPDCGTPL